jgi:regulator of sigma E protease
MMKRECELKRFNMLLNIVYIILAALGLSFLIFIHELGHYIVARRNGMRVEVFSIGFGKPLIAWKVGDVKWQICYVIFGGYVKISGMEKEKDKEPHEVEGGFYASSPWARIKVAFMGPIVNIVFAFILFSVIWMAGGRMKPFAEFTQIIGAVDQKSELFEKGVRSGDELTRLNGNQYTGYKDLIYASVVKSDRVSMEGYMVDYYSDRREPFKVGVKPFVDPRTTQSGINSLGILTPASYLLFDQGADPDYDPLGVGTPLHNSGIKNGDRIIWANGELIFSVQRLNQIMNEKSSILTIARGNTQFLAKVPRMQVSDIRLSYDEKGEIDDWQHELGLSGKLEQLTFVPYSLTSQLEVKKPFSFVNEESHLSTVKSRSRTSHLDILLRTGDRIVAVDGVPVETGYEFLQSLQKKRVQFIVQHLPVESAPILWKNEDQAFLHSVNWDHLSEIVRSMPYAPKSNIGDLTLLTPVAPELMKNLPLTAERKEKLNAAYAAQRKELQKLSDPAKRESSMRFLEELEHRLVLGIAPRDRMVIYNPGPFALCGDVITQTTQTLGALVTGKLHPKWLSGPVGMVQIMHHGWTVGLKEALYWLATISLSLGIINLFPLPVLDGGHICFSLYEWITKKRVSSKAMERMIIPFVVLMIGLFIYLTFNDLSRLVSLFK